MSVSLTPKREVLIVDDDPFVTEALAKSLRKFRSKWNLQVVTSGREALEALDSRPRDALISDVRMPEMDGEALLTEVQRRWPGVVRVVLTGEAKRETMRHLSAIAHQLLAKPVTAEAIFERVEAALAARDQLVSPALRALVCQLGTLPTMPKTYAALLELSQDPEADLEVVAALVEQDPAVSACALRVVNSAYFGMPRRVESIREAVRLLGLQPLLDVVLTVEVYPETSAHSVELQNQAARRLVGLHRLAHVARQEPLAELASTAVVLCDLGRILLDQDEARRAAIEQARATAPSLCAAEASVVGLDHAVVSAVLLGLWTMPPALIHAVACHHQLSKTPPGSIEELVAAAVVLAEPDAAARLPEVARRYLVELPVIASIARELSS